MLMRTETSLPSARCPGVFALRHSAAAAPEPSAATAAIARLRRRTMRTALFVFGGFGFRQPAEMIVLREAFRCQPPGVGAVAAPIRKLLDRQGERAPCRIKPRQTVCRLEGLHVGQVTVLVALQAHA